MRSLKAYYYDGKLFLDTLWHLLFYIFGITGAFIVAYGYTQPDAQEFYVAGSLLLLVTALYYKLVYFIALELILLAGHGAVLLQLGAASQLSVPVLLTFQLFIYYLLSGLLNNIYRITGIFGIAFFSVGFTYSSSLIFLIGNICISVFAFYHIVCNDRVAIIWFLLNLFFVIATGYSYITQYLPGV